MLTGLLFSVTDAMAIGQVALCDGGVFSFHAFTTGGDGPFSCDHCTLPGQEVHEFTVLSRNANGKPSEIEITDPQNLGIHLFYGQGKLRAVSDQTGEVLAEASCRRMDM